MSRDHNKMQTKTVLLMSAEQQTKNFTTVPDEDVSTKNFTTVIVMRHHHHQQILRVIAPSAWRDRPLGMADMMDPPGARARGQEQEGMNGTSLTP